MGHLSFKPVLVNSVCWGFWVEKCVDREGLKVPQASGCNGRESLKISTITVTKHGCNFLTGLGRIDGNYEV